MFLNLSDTASQFTGAPRQAAYALYLEASVEHVFNYVTAHDIICDLIPGMQKVFVRETETGTVRCCDFGNDMLLQEHVVLWKPPNQFGYQAITPNPFGLWEHLALISCQTDRAGMILQWWHYFEHDDLPVMRAMLDDMFANIWQRLVDHFGGYPLSIESLASKRSA